MKLLTIINLCFINWKTSFQRCKYNDYGLYRSL